MFQERVHLASRAIEDRAVAGSGGDELERVQMRKAIKPVAAGELASFRLQLVAPWPSAKERPSRIRGDSACDFERNGVALFALCIEL
jgi:hypothetical protein